MIHFDYSVIVYLVRALKAELRTVEVYHFVPAGAPLPYVSVELIHIGRGNGLPSPHFTCQIKVDLKVWSAYQGLKELHEIVQKMARYLSGRTLPIPEGSIHIILGEVAFVGQQDSKAQSLRCASMGLTLQLRL